CAPAPRERWPGAAPRAHLPHCVREVTACPLRSQAGPGCTGPDRASRFAPARSGAGSLRSPAQRPLRLRLQDRMAR
ncbi:hypothetical protein, partial [Streptomyces sundarbansensis]